jgi:hypothetical protein
MARPIKTGLDYFPMDVDFFTDEKIEAIHGEFGLKGEIIVIKLLCTIYRNGYFAMWNDLTKMKLLKSLPGVSLELLELVITRLVKWNFFDENLFNSEKVLTSNGIQNRYFEATKKRKNDNNLVYVVNNPSFRGINPTTSVVNAEFSTQSKVKESKVKERKEEERKNPPHPFFDPNSHIPKIEMVIEQFYLKGGNELMAHRFFEKHSATGFMIRNSRLTHWQSLVPTFIRIWKENESKNTSTSTTNHLTLEV